MTNPSLVAQAPKKNGTNGNHLAQLTPVAPRRFGHGGTVRPEALTAEQLRQPQDGAPVRAKLATITAHLQNDFFQESEDARLTGGTRSLKRRLLGLNLGLKRKMPAMVAGPIVRPKVA